MRAFGKLESLIPWPPYLKLEAKSEKQQGYCIN